MNPKLPIIGTLLAALALSAFAATPSDDPIAALETRLCTYGGMWVRTQTPIIPLPPSASAEQVAEAFFKGDGLGPGRVTRFEVVRTTNILPHAHATNTMRAALIATELGRKILVMESRSPTRWWTKCFDVDLTDAEIFAALAQRIRAVAPDAALVTNDTSLTASLRTMTFKVHGRSMTGEIAKEAHDEVGPTHTGFLLCAAVQPKGETNQAETPQTLDEPYWRSDLDVTPVQGSSRQLYWSLRYGRRTDTNLLAQLRTAVRALASDPVVTRKVQP